MIFYLFLVCKYHFIKKHFILHLKRSYQQHSLFFKTRNKNVLHAQFTYITPAHCGASLSCRPVWPADCLHQCPVETLDQTLFTTGTSCVSQLDLWSSCSVLTVKEVIVIDSLYTARVHAQSSNLDFLWRQEGKDHWDNSTEPRFIGNLQCSSHSCDKFISSPPAEHCYYWYQHVVVGNW